MISSLKRVNTQHIMCEYTSAIALSANILQRESIREDRIILLLLIEITLNTLLRSLSKLLITQLYR